MNTINVIIYPRGYGGNILRFLLSLHDHTYPLYPRGEINRDRPRHEIYSFKNLKWKYGNWREYEESQGKIRSIDYVSMFLNQEATQYTTLTVADHTDEANFEIFRNGNIKLNFITIDVSEKYLPYINSFLQTEMKNPTNINEYHNRFNDIEKYKKNFNPYVVNHDCFLEGEESFLSEYKQLLTHLNYPHDENILNDALTLYRGWHSARMPILPKKTSI